MSLIPHCLEKVNQTLVDLLDRPVPEIYCVGEAVVDLIAHRHHEY